MEERSGIHNPFIQILARVGDLMIANFLFILCSLPLITAGAAMAALTKITQDIAMETESGIFKSFFRAFRDNFKQATAVWLGEALVIAALICYYMLVGIYCTGTLAAVLNGVLVVVAIIFLCVAVFLMPMVVRYENTLREHLKNSWILCICKLPRTIAMGALILILPLLYRYASPTTFLYTLFFWLVVGFAFISYLCSRLLRPVFEELERSPDGKSGISIMK